MIAGEQHWKDGELSCESPAAGLRVYQPKRGYRYAMDPFLLAGFALEGWGSEREQGRFVEVGSGCGVLSLLLARLGWWGLGVDIEPAWTALSRRSCSESGLDGQLQFLNADVRQFQGPIAGGPPDLVLFNPPYFRRSSGHLPADPLVAAARFDVHGALSEVISAASTLAPRICLVVPMERCRESVRALEHAGRPLRRRIDLLPKLCLLEGQKSGGESPVREEWGMRVEGQHHPRIVAWYASLGAVLQPAGSGAVGHRSTMPELR